MKISAQKVAARYMSAVVACGECYRYAYQRIREKGGTLVHGTVQKPFARPAYEYAHAWVEHKGIVYDWQTMEAMHGGNWRGKGYPKKVFYELFKPTKMTRYTADEALMIFAKSRGGRTTGMQHYGPWR